MSGNPSNIGRTPPHIVFFEVEDPMQRLSRANLVATMNMLNTFGLACGSRRVKDE